MAITKGANVQCFLRSINKSLAAIKFVSLLNFLARPTDDDCRLSVTEKSTRSEVRDVAKLDKDLSACYWGSGDQRLFYSTIKMVESETRRSHW